MLIAKTTTGAIVKATEAQRQTSYSCPSCLGAVLLKRGEQNLPHFAHVSLVDCHVFAEGESVEHLTGKLQLVAFFEARGYDVALEAWLPELQQRPDLMITKDGQRTVIEYQCAPITVAKVQQRTAGYRRIGLPVIWILGATYQAKRLSGKTFAKFATLHEGLMLYTWQTATARLNQRQWLAVDGVREVQQAISDATLARQGLTISQGLVRRQPELMTWQAELYQQGRHLAGLPWECHVLQPLPGGPAEPQWSMVLRILLALEAESLSFTDLLRVIQTGKWHNFGCVKRRDVQALWLNVLLTEWQRLQVITITDGLISFRQPPRWYGDYSQKQCQSHDWFLRGS